jgi:transposase-like protein
MPRAGQTKHKPAVIEKAVKRHLEGDELVADLAKELKVSRQTFYSWIEAYKKQAMANIDRVGKSKGELEKIDKVQLIAQNELLQTENRKLRDRLVDLMIKYGEIP